MSQFDRLISMSIGLSALWIVSAGCDSAPVPPVAAPPAAAPPPPPPSPVAESVAAAPSAADPSSGEIPAWAGQRPDEPFDVRQFLASRAAPPDNAAPHYLAALAPICAELSGGSPNALQTEISELAKTAADGGRQDSRAADVLAQTANVVAQVDAAQRNPNCVFVTGHSADTNLSHLQAAINLRRLSELQLYHARATGDFSAAEAAARRALRMSRDIQPRGGFVSQLVSISIDGNIVVAIEKTLINDSRITVEQCDRLLSLLAEHQSRSLDRLQEGLRVEYVLYRNNLQDLQSGRLTVDRMIEALGGDLSSPSTLNSGLVNYDAEIATCNQLYRLLVEGTRERANRNAAFTSFQVEMRKRKMVLDQFKAKIAATPAADRPQLRSEAPSYLEYMLTASIAPLFESILRGETALAAEQMLIALRRYERAHGMLPATLEPAAAESSLKVVPTDPYSGQPLKYALVDGKPTVYSVGKDKQDDGGQIDWNFGKQPGDFRFHLTPLQ